MAQPRVTTDLADACVVLAQTQLVGQLADETSLDARMMGTLGFAGALLAADIAAKDALGHDWWTPAVVSCLGPALGIGRNFKRDTDLGPSAKDFFATYGTQPSKLAHEQLLTDLDQSLRNNGRRLKAKQRALRTAVSLLVLGFVGSGIAIESTRLLN